MSAGSAKPLQESEASARGQACAQLSRVERNGARIVCSMWTPFVSRSSIEPWQAGHCMGAATPGSFALFDQFQTSIVLARDRIEKAVP